MTFHELVIAKRTLDALYELDGGQAHALALHAQIGGLRLCPTREFEAVLAEMDRRHWVLGITTRFKGVLWSLSDAGAAARLQM